MIKGNLIENCMKYCKGSNASMSCYQDNKNKGSCSTYRALNSNLFVHKDLIMDGVEDKLDNFLYTQMKNDLSKIIEQHWQFKVPFNQTVELMNNVKEKYLK